MSGLEHYFLPHQSNNHRAKLLHPSLIFSLIVAVLGFQILVSRVTIHLPRILGYASQISPSEIINLTNGDRQASGLSILKYDPELSQAAAAKAADMFARDYWAHVSPVGTQPWFFISESGYAYRYAGENLARDFSDPSSVVNAWMASPSHRENLLNPRYQDIGVAVVDGRLQGKDTTLVVQMFGTRLAAAPTLGTSSTFAVKAAEPEITPLPTPVPVQIHTATTATPVLVSPFFLSKTASLVILGAILLTLILDIIIVQHRHINRWTSKSLAHLIFLGLLFIAAAVIFRGQII